jgi:hypothetical protein
VLFDEGKGGFFCYYSILKKGEVILKKDTKIKQAVNHHLRIRDILISEIEIIITIAGRGRPFCEDDRLLQYYLIINEVIYESNQ